MIRLLERPVRILRLRTARGDEAERALRDAGRLLQEGPCAVCRERDDSAGRWLTYFIAESHTDAGVLSRLTAAVGFCPAHTRRLLADPSASWLMPQVHDAALRGGMRLLTDHADQTARPAPCPACGNGRDAEERALSTLLRVLDRTQVRNAVDGGAVCLPHVVALAARTGTDTALRLAEAACAHLDEHPPQLIWLAGMDPDAGRRADQLARLDPFLPVEQARQEYAVADRWEADLEIGCCPLCLAGQRTVRRLLRWMATSTGRGGPAREETGLCPRHLHDFTALDGPGVTGILAAGAETWLSRLTRFRKLLAEGRNGRRTAQVQLAQAPRCRACQEGKIAERRQLALMSAQLLDPVRAHAYEYTHGVCLRHALAHSDALPATAHTVLTARLAQLRWEVDEALRKQDWHTRHEVKGAEMTVAHRAPTLLDGRVYAGLPAPPPPAESRERDRHPDESYPRPQDDAADATRR